jgi:hypothetical protein
MLLGSRPRATVSKPTTRPVKPSPDRVKPSQSNGGGSSRKFSMKSVTRTMPNMPIGTLIQKIQRQEK